MNDASWIDRFIRHLEFERRLSPLTCKNYRRDLETLATYCEQAGVAEWRDLDSEHVRAYAAACFRKGLGGKSIQRRLSAARTFYRYLLREKVVSKSPVTCTWPTATASTPSRPPASTSTRRGSTKTSAD